MRVIIGIVAVVALLAFVAASGGSTADALSSCSDYAVQADAQRAADTSDADGDGIYCEELPCPCNSASPSPSAPGGSDGRSRSRLAPAQTYPAQVTAVTDGDTIRVAALDTSTGHAHYRVRIIGIDTPEKYGDVECGAREASASMRRLAPVGTRVELLSDPSQALFDRYGRMLAYVERDGRDLGRAQVGRGWASTYVYEGQPFERFASYRHAQSEAQKHGRGVYAVCSGCSSVKSGQG